MNLQKLRQKIDQVDQKLVDLINERTKIVLEIGKQKIKNGQEIYSPEREVSVYQNILDKNNGPLPAEALKSIFCEIMSSALAMEKELKVAYLGPKATFTHQASIQKFGSSVGYAPMDSISDIFLEVEKGRADYGVVPIENSVEGAVNHTLDVFIESELKICSEILLKINHTLLSNVELDQIQKIYSNPQVFGQCRNWLKKNLPHAEQIEVSSTSRGAEIAVKEPHAASIGNLLGAHVHGLKVLAENIEDFSSNITRFLVIGQHAAKPTGKDKTSVVFSIKDKVGALTEVLLPFKKHKINLTKIESRPSKKKAWEYYFYVDFLGHQEESSVKKTLQGLAKHCNFLKVLGSYPFMTRD